MQEDSIETLLEISLGRPNRKVIELILENYTEMQTALAKLLSYKG